MEAYEAHAADAPYAADALHAVHAAHAAHAKSKYLFYTCWETIGSHGGIIAGSYLHKKFAQTKEEANDILSNIKEQAAKAAESSYWNTSTIRRYVYIENNPDWWTRT